MAFKLGRYAHHCGVGGNIACDKRIGCNDGIVTYGNLPYNNCIGGNIDPISDSGYAALLTTPGYANGNALRDIAGVPYDSVLTDKDVAEVTNIEARTNDCLAGD